MTAWLWAVGLGAFALLGWVYSRRKRRARLLALGLLLGERVRIGWPPSSTGRVEFLFFARGEIARVDAAEAGRVVLRDLEVEEGAGNRESLYLREVEELGIPILGIRLREVLRNG